MRQHDGNLADSTSDVSTFGKALPHFLTCVHSVAAANSPRGIWANKCYMHNDEWRGRDKARTRAFFSFYAGVLVVHIHPHRFAQMLWVRHWTFHDISSVLDCFTHNYSAYISSLSEKYIGRIFIFVIYIESLKSLIIYHFSSIFFHPWVFPWLACFSREEKSIIYYSLFRMWSIWGEQDERSQRVFFRNQNKCSQQIGAWLSVSSWDEKI